MDQDPVKGRRTSSKGRVAIIGTRGYPSYYGGFETAVRHIAPFLVDAGWEVIVYGRPGAVKDDDKNRDLRVQSVPTRGIETKSLSTLSYGLSAVVNAIRRRADVALVMNVANGFWLPLLKVFGIPTLVNVDGIEWHRDKWGSAAKRVFYTGAKLTARYADELVMDSKAINDYWKTEFHRGGIFLPYGGETSGLLPVPFGLQKRKYALIVARFVPENSVEEFFASVPKIQEFADVVIVGSSGYGGKFDDAARLLAAKYGRVQWLGHVSDDDLLKSLWQNCGAYFHGHTVGGTNPALVQAMASGAPVIARSTIYNEEVLDDPTQVTKSDSTSIAHSIKGMIEDSAAQERASHRNRVRAEEIYSWNRICRGYQDALEDLTSESKRKSAAL